MALTRIMATAALVATLFAPASAVAGDTTQVVAMGRAYQASEADRETARRRAVVDALANAVLSGGAVLRGHTAMSNGRITSDFSILRPTGQVLAHRVIEERYENGIWFVSVSAEVGAQPVGGCASRRHMVLSAEPPRFRTDPRAPAWAEGLGRSLMNDVLDQVAQHPAISLDRIVDTNRAPNSALDYMTLTRGRSVQAAGDHRLQSAAGVSVNGGNIVLSISLSFAGPDGRIGKRDFSASARQPKGGAMDIVSGASRRTAEDRLRRSLTQDIGEYLDLLTCEAPSAQIALSGSELSVPIGRRHGVGRAALGIVDDKGSNFGLLEITDLRNNRTVLRPIDPTKPLSGFAGMRVYFLDAGL